MHHKWSAPILAFVLLSSFFAAGWAVKKDDPDVGLATDRINRSELCGECHSDIYSAWKGSLHARSFTDSIFQAAFEKATNERGAGVRRLCLSCHAPVALVNGDIDVKQAVTREGIGCDFCHSVKSVDLTRRPMPFEVELGGVKRGPFEYLESPAHETAFSALHKTSPLLCAACHEYVNDVGAAVFSTYTEWSEGPYPALGVSCQDCHMAIVPGERVQAGLSSAPDERLINVHRLVGGSSLSQLRRGLDASTRSVERKSGQVEIVVEVQNVAAGHKVPTGLPFKQAILELVARQGERTVYQEERVYARTLVDEKGRRAVSDAAVYIDSLRIAGDTRLAPKEVRAERFRFPAPPGKIDFNARLLYRYKPLASEKGVEEVIRELKGTVPR